MNPFAVTRTLSKPLCPLFPSSALYSNIPVSHGGDKRKRTLSNEVPHADSLSSTSSTRKSLHPPFSTEDDGDFVDNRSFDIPPRPPSSASSSALTRKSLPEAPRKRRLHARTAAASGTRSSADDSAEPRTIIDMTESPDQRKVAPSHSFRLPTAPSPFPPLPALSHPKTSDDAALHSQFSSQCSLDEEPSTAADVAIVYDTSQEHDDDAQLTQEMPAAAIAPTPPTAPPSRAAVPLAEVRRQPSALVGALVRTSSMASATSLSQCEDYCTPLDQPVKQRSDQERALDILNARQLQHSSALPTSSSSSAAPSAFLSAPAPAISTNVFLPFAMRHSRTDRVVAPPVSLPAPSSRLLSEYVVLRMVGEGSFGCVMQCRHRLDGALYAVKRLKRLSGGRGGLGELRECWALAALTSAGHCPASLLRYHSSWYEDHQLYLASEWCEGPTLAHALLGRPHTEAEVIAFLLQLASALRYLHRLGFAHLDVKPDNVLALPAGDAGLLYKLIDYGLVHPLSSQPQSLSAIGDHRYASQYAIEHEDHAEALDKIDVFALALSALELLHGRQLTQAEREAARAGDLSWTEGAEDGRMRGRLGEVMAGMTAVDMWERLDAEDIVRLLQEEEEGVGHVALEHRVLELTAEADQWRQRCEAAERERDASKERTSQLEQYVAQVQRHMARLHI